jgi:hypothetical protein
MTCDNRSKVYTFPTSLCKEGAVGPSGPRGETGDSGPAGPSGVQGIPGVGLPSGGTTGQILIKLSNNNYDVGWANVTGIIEPPPDPGGGTPTVITPAVVPNKAAYWAMLEEWDPYIDGYWTNETNGGFKQLQTYYDGELCRYRLRDHFATTSPYYASADKSNQWYSSYYVQPNNGSLPGYWVFPQGLVERFIRRADANAKTQALNLLNNASYANTQAAGEDLSTQEYSREVAYALEAKIHCPKMSGVILTSTQLTRRSQLFEWSLGHLHIWASNLGSYCRPFMVGITCKALIDYWENVAQDPRIKTNIIAIVDYIWNTCWNAAGQAFNYTDRATGIEPTDLQPQPDLNMIVAPIYGWLWSQTGNAIYRTRGDQIFTGGISVYSGAVHVSGSWLGTRDSSNPAGKQYNQQLYWGPRYIEWGELPVTIP